MLKNEMLREVTERASDLAEKKITKKDVETVLTAFADCVLNNLAENRDERIPFPGIGMFSVKHVNERSGIAAIGDGKPWTVPAHDEVRFQVAKSAKVLA